MLNFIFEWTNRFISFKILLIPNFWTEVYFTDRMINYNMVIYYINHVFLAFTAKSDLKLFIPWHNILAISPNSTVMTQIRNANASVLFRHCKQMRTEKNIKDCTVYTLILQQSRKSRCGLWNLLGWSFHQGFMYICIFYLSAAVGGGLRCLLTLAYRPSRGSSVDGSLLWDTGGGGLCGEVLRFPYGGWEGDPRSLKLLMRA